MFSEELRSKAIEICREVSEETGIPMPTLVSRKGIKGFSGVARREAQRRIVERLDGVKHADLAQFFGISVRRVRKSVLFAKRDAYGRVLSARTSSASFLPK